MNNTKKGFTLVELIVVITILAILGTIAFLAFQNYSASARDSKRIADLNTIKTSLELFGLNSGKFPNPVNPVTINYSSGSITDINMRYQGVFGEQNVTNVSSAGKLDRLPKDPLTEIEYTYSITLDQKEFELGTILENDEVAFNPIIGVNAASKKVVSAFIKGNYNGKILKTSSGGINYIFAVPSIINSDATLTDYSSLINNHKLAYNSFANLPASYDGPVFEVNGAPDSNFVNVNEVLVFTGTSYSDLINPNVPDSRLDLLQAIKDAYSGTDLASVGGIKEIVNSDPSNPTATENNLAGIIVNSELGGNVEIVPDTSSGTIGGDTTLTHYNPQLNWWTDDPDCELSTTCDYTDGITDGAEDYCGKNDGCDCWWNSENDPITESFCPVGGDGGGIPETCTRVSVFDDTKWESDINWEGNPKMSWNSTNNYWYFNPTTKRIWNNGDQIFITYPGEYYYNGTLKAIGGWNTITYKPEKIRITNNKGLINNVYIQSGGGDWSIYKSNVYSEDPILLEYTDLFTGIDEIYFRGMFVSDQIYSNIDDTQITNIEFCESNLLACNDITQTVADTLNSSFGFDYSISEWCGLTSLDLSNKGLSTIPGEIGYLVNLKELLLNDNNLTTIPGNLSNLKNLTTLDLSGNIGLLSFNQRFEGDTGYGFCLEEIGITITSGDNLISGGKVRIFDECMVF